MMRPQAAVPRRVASPYRGGAGGRRPTDEGAEVHSRILPLIRPSVRTGAPSPLWGEG